MASCGECKNKIDRSDDKKMECAICHMFFHAACVNMQPADVEYFKREKLIFKCNSCNNSRKLISLSKSPPVTPISLNSINNKKQTEKDQNNVDHNKSKYSTENKNSTDLKLDNITESLKKIYESIDETKKVLFDKIKEVEDNLKKSLIELKNENVILKNEIIVLNDRVDNLEQSALNNSVDIIGFPFIKDSNVLQSAVLNLFCDSMNVEIKSENIVSCYQKKMSKEIDSKSIVCVKFNSSLKKDIVMRAKKILKNKSIVFNGDSDEQTNVECYINNSMTAKKRHIFNVANKMKKQHKVKYLWFRNGRILMRFEDGSEIKVINDLMDLEQFKREFLSSAFTNVAKQ